MFFQVVGLLFNLYLWPGLGTMIGGWPLKGLAQGFLFLGCWVGISALLVLGRDDRIITLSILGAGVIAIWIWALISSARQIRDRGAQARLG